MTINIQLHYYNNLNIEPKGNQMHKNHGIYIGEGSLKPHSSPHQYAQSCQLYQTFAEISRIVARKNNMNSSQALSEYLNQCNKGEHVVLKSYSSFSKSYLNRQCFLYNFCKIFQTQTNVRNGLDYYQLFRLLCSDFPKEIITNAVRLIEGEHDKMMEILINSQNFLNALYISFIYSEYFEAMLQKLFHAKHEEERPITQILNYIKAEEQRNQYILSKPPKEILYQIILNILGSKNTIKQRGITFVKEQTIEQFVGNCVGENKNSVTISYEKFVSLLLDNKMHQKLVSKNIFCFDNSANWANEVGKLLNVKDSDHPQPLNSKKMKKK